MRNRQLNLLFVLSFAAIAACFLSLPTSRGQDWFSTGINLGAPRIRLAVSEFQPQSTDAELVRLTKEFNDVLSNDLDQAGIFEMVSKSMFPLKVPVEPAGVDFQAWSSPPAEDHAS